MLFRSKAITRSFHKVIIHPLSRSELLLYMFGKSFISTIYIATLHCPGKKSFICIPYYLIFLVLCLTTFFLHPLQRGISSGSFRRIRYYMSILISKIISDNNTYVRELKSLRSMYTTNLIYCIIINCPCRCITEIPVCTEILILDYYILLFIT